MIDPQDLVTLWELDQITPLATSSTATLFKFIQRTPNKSVVIKCYKTLPTFEQEAAALKAFQGYNCVELLDISEQHQALLLEAIEPGTTLNNLFPNQDDIAAEIVSSLIKKLHQAPIPTIGSLPILKTWLKTIFTKQSPTLIPQTLLRAAQKLAENLLNEAVTPALLHGDLHHENILKQNNEWIAIDPKGVIGHPAYDIAPFLYNPIMELSVHPALANILIKRINSFSKLFAIDKEILLSWGLVHAVAAACWAEEDGQSPTKWITVAHALHAILRD